jgi:biopolymer transport protein ExbB/TolQ
MIVVTTVMVFLIVVMIMIVVVIMNVLMIVVRMSLTLSRVFVPPELGRRYSGAQHALGADAANLQGEAPQRQTELVERQADIEQCAEHHVSGRPGKAIEVRGFRHVRGFPSREN